MNKSKSFHILLIFFGMVIAFSANAQLQVISTVVGGAYNIGDGGPATSAQISSVSGVAVDAGGNIYIADVSNNSVRRVDSSTGIISNLVGGLPSNLFSYPIGLTLDGVGNLYVCDQRNVSKVSIATGVVTRVAGNFNVGFNGDNQPATNASLYFPLGVAIDGSGNVYIADQINSRVRKVDTSGIITTVAGTGTPGSTGDNGPATSAQLINPSGVAVDGSNLYIADGGARIRKVNLTTGIITTVAGDGTYGYSGDNGPATSAQLSTANAIALDGSGNLFVADQNGTRVRKVIASTGIIVPVAGNGVAGYSGDNGPATSAQLSGQQSGQQIGLTVDGGGNLYIADCANKRIRKVDGTGIITTVAGNGVYGFSGDNGLGSNAQLNVPEDIAMDASGNLYIADLSNNRVRKVSSSTGIITTVAGNGTAGYSGDNGPAVGAQLRAYALAVDGTGNLYISDLYRIRKVSASTGDISTVVGTGVAGYSGDNGPATSAQFVGPSRLVVDNTGNLYFSDQQNHRVRMVNAATGIVTTIAGDGTAAYSGDNGPASSAQLSNPNGLAIDASGSLYVADRGNYRIRKINASTGIITTIAGIGTSGQSGDNGPATSAQLGVPWAGVAVDGAGNFWFVDGHAVRKISSSGIISTVAGFSAGTGFSGDGGPVINALFTNPGGLVVDAIGDLYVADASNNRIRKITTIPGPTISSFSPTSGPVGTTVVITGTNFDASTAANNAVKFNGVAAIVTASTSTSLTTTVPSGATSGKITVTVGGQTGTSGSDFTVQSAAVITVSVNSINVSNGSTVSFASTNVGATTNTDFIISNTGVATLAISNIARTGDYAITSAIPTSIVGGSSSSIQIAFSPTATGARTGTLTITSNASASPFIVNLSGSGVIVAPVFSVSVDGTARTSGSSVNFSSLLLGEQAQKNFVVTNTGTVAVAIASISATGDYSVTSSIPTSIVAGASSTISVRFSPTGVGASNGTLTINSNSSTPVFTLSLTGQGVQPLPVIDIGFEGTPVVSGNSVRFPVAYVGFDIHRSIDIQNKGTASLVITDIQVSGDFSLASAIPPPIDPGAKAEIDIMFTPTNLGERSGTISIFSNGDIPVYTFTIVGEGYAEPEVYNVVTVNPNGKHDFLNIRNITLFPNNIVSIYDRWGNHVFEKQNYDNVEGTFAGLGDDNKQLPEGTYYYVIDKGNGAAKITGFLLLRR